MQFKVTAREKGSWPLLKAKCSRRPVKTSYKNHQ